MDDSKVDDFISANPSWSHEGGSLSRTYELIDFRTAIAFIVLFSYLSDDANHHAEINNTYNVVTIQLTTHDDGNVVSAKDLFLAAQCEEMFVVRFS